ncbi:MAG: hypothetical protein CVT92_07885 [Bacteroidetes bacterium HGW-Bacteroidetes-1]|nr:MAG: hypothetical protein CVT92_07885 [Bacteroidetes bacterium HGW-Bacteroidetes-1]
MQQKLIHIILFVLICFSAMGQEDSTTERIKNYALDGYISNMQSVMFDSIHKNWISDNILHNRLNFSWLPTPTFTATIQIRNRFIWGESVKYNSNYSKQIAKDNGYLKLSWNVFDEQSFVFNTSIERAFIQFSKGKFDFKLGRQRINWGQTMVWNPNDIFNNYSFFDFDYIERPGSDAFRLQYYPSSSSTIEFTAKINSNKELTTAALYRFNKWNYDIQFIGGLLNEQDIFFGAGWSGAIKSISFRGEFSFFQPKENFADTSGLAMATLSFDYTFKNSSMILVEGLYGNFSNNAGSGFMDLYAAPASVKNLSFTKYNILSQYSYPISTLVNLTISGMYMPKIKGYYTGSTISISLKDNLDISFIGQVFSGEFPDSVSGNNKRVNYYMGFLRLKGNF